jgi:tripartite-type tricarboxylate transporter receptor subunit TctC
MNFTRRKLFEAMLVAPVVALAAALPATALAQTYPAKSIRMIVPFPPGGTTDIIARILAQPLAQALGQPVIVDNRPGADGAIAGETVMKAAADGYTLLLATNSTLSVVPTLRKNPPYDPVTDFTPISHVGRFTFFVFVHPGVPAKTLAELVSYAQANPGKLNYGTGNSISIVASAQLKSLAGIDMVHVPYKGDGPATTDLLAGRVQLVIASAVPGLALAKEGKVRALATLLARRSPHLPDVPTMAEAGFPKYSVAPWAGLFGPAKLPREIVERLAKETNAILQRQEVRDQLDRQAFEGQGSTPDELGVLVKEQLEVWRRAVREAGIQPD